MNVICVTGTPGTGKTTVAKKLAKQKKYQYIDVNKAIREHKLSDGYDRKRKAKIIDIKKLNKVLINIITKAKKDKCLGLVIDSHLSHYLPKKHVSLCIVTKTSLKRLKARLERRHYTKAKVRENLDCEIFDICCNEAREAGHKVKIIQT